MLTAAPGSDDPPQAISQPRTSAPAESTVPAFAAHRRSRPKPPRRRNGPSAYRVTAPHRPVRPPHQSPIVQPSWRRTLHRISRSSINRGDPDEHIDRGPQQAPRPGARQAHRPGALQSSRAHDVPQLRPSPCGFLLMSSNLDDSSPARPQDPARSFAPDRSSPARRPDHRDKQVGQARLPATPLLSDGDIMGFNSPGQHHTAHSPDERERTQVRLAARVVHRGGFGTCVPGAWTG